MDTILTNNISLTRESFSQMVSNNKTALINYAIHLMRDYDEAMDLYQETMYTAFKRRSRFRDNTNFKGWLMVIMRNLFINEYHKAKRYPGQSLTDEALFIANKTHHNKNTGPQNIVYDEVISKVKSLDEIYRTSFMMFYEGFKYTEIADRIGVPLGTVKNRIHKARKLLQHKIIN